MLLKVPSKLQVHCLFIHGKETITAVDFLCETVNYKLDCKCCIEAKTIDTDSQQTAGGQRGWM